MPKHEFEGYRGLALLLDSACVKPPQSRLWLVSEAGHIKASDIIFEEYVKRVVDFFDEYLSASK